MRVGRSFGRRRDQEPPAVGQEARRRKVRRDRARWAATATGPRRWAAAPGDRRRPASRAPTACRATAPAARRRRAAPPARRRSCAGRSIARRRRLPTTPRAQRWCRRRERSQAVEPSSHDRSRSLALPGPRTITPAPHASRVTRARPSGDDVVQRQRGRRRQEQPLRRRCASRRGSPGRRRVRVPVNQISSPPGAHARPSTLFHPDESVRARARPGPPARPSPAVSPDTGCASTATASPDGRDADVGDVARAGIVERRADRVLEHVAGRCRCGRWPAPMPSGRQSAASTPCASCRGTPPASGARASVPSTRPKPLGPEHDRHLVPSTTSRRCRCRSSAAAGPRARRAGSRTARSGRPSQAAP